MTEFQRYFTVYENYYWKFESDTSLSDKSEYIISITNGNTIIYMEELIEMITFLEPQGIPMLSPLLLSLAATNANGKESLDKTRSIFADILPEEYYGSSDLNKAFEFLKKINHLPRQYKSGKQRRLVLQAIFKNCHNMVSSVKTRLILKQYKRFSTTLDSRLITEDFIPAVLFKELKVLALLNRKFHNTDDIIRAVQNLPDNDEINDALEEEILESDALADKPVDFIEQLVRDERTFQIGSLIKRLWGSLQIPFHHNVPSGQPLGGISDLSNKGSFDKLLISEFANDDDVFISRIANNEALYIEREIPPQQDKITRIFLIDTSLKNWGTPKILSYAISIAILKHPKNEINCKFYLIGNTYREIELSDIDNVISNMNILSGTLDASPGLEHFFSDHQKVKNTEVFLLTSVNAMKMASVQKTIATYKDQLSFLILSDIEGQIHLYKYRNQSKKHIQTITLPLENLWQKKATTVRKKATAKDELPKIPILYPVSKSNSYTFVANDEYFIYNRGCLYKFQSLNADKGFELIASGLDFPYGEFTMLKNNGDDVLVYFDYAKDDIIYYNIQHQKQESYHIKNGFNNSHVIILFTHKNKLHFKSETDIYEVVNHAELVSVKKDPVVQHDQVFQKHKEDTDEFKMKIKRQRGNYNVIANLNNIYMDEEDVIINGFCLSQSGFYKQEIAEEDEYKYALKVNLILKDSGNKKIDIVKIIKENTSCSLKEAAGYVDAYRPVILHSVSLNEAETLKRELENYGAICYITNVSFEFNEGSKITMQNGILIFKSSNVKIPVFYIPFIIGQGIAFATDYEFAGNEYFLPYKHSLTQIIEYDFFKKYINPFMENIQNVTTA